jgi:hypothetical protein
VPGFAAVCGVLHPLVRDCQNNAHFVNGAGGDEGRK